MYLNKLYAEVHAFNTVICLLVSTSFYWCFFYSHINISLLIHVSTSLSCRLDLSNLSLEHTPTLTQRGVSPSSYRRRT